MSFICPLCCFTLQFITICTDFYSFVLCSSLSASSVICPCPLPQCCVWYIPALHMTFYHAIALGYNFLLLLFCFRLSFINLILSFLLPHRSCECSPVSCYHTSFDHGAFLYSYTDYHKPLHPTTCNNPIGWHHSTETFSLPTLISI